MMARAGVGRALVALVAAAGLAVAPAGVAAHGLAPGDGGMSLGLVTGLVVGVGVLAGVAAATGRTAREDGPLSRTIVRAVGPLLLVLGVLAAVSVLRRHPSVGVAGLAVGAGVGAAAVHRGASHAGVTAGAVVVHRLVEGATLAVAYSAGSAAGLAGVLVLAVHTVAECVVVGGTHGVDRRRAAGVVLAVGASFAGGVALGTLGLAGLPATPRLGLLALVGGLLIGVGTDKIRSHPPVAG